MFTLSRNLVTAHNSQRKPIDVAPVLVCQFNRGFYSTDILLLSIFLPISKR